MSEVDKRTEFLVHYVGAQQLEKLRLPKNVAKAHWLTDEGDPEGQQAFLLKRIEGEVQELKQAIADGESVAAVWAEVADVCNMAMMAADFYENDGGRIERAVKAVMGVRYVEPDSVHDKGFASFRQEHGGN